MRKATSLVSAWLALVFAFTAVLGNVAAAPAYKSVAGGVSTAAEAAALIDVQSGRMLYAKAGDKRMRIASLTKIMTAIVAIERGNLSDIVVVSGNAAGKEGSTLYLKQGEEMSLHNMLYGLMLRSGNDAATAIAEHVGGSVEGFAYMMNETAELIGMTGTHFDNPSGLDSETHFSTANDMARLTAYALRNPAFQDIVKTKVKTAPNPNEPWDYKWSNKNKMLSLFDGADGVKTGYTKLAKRCLVSSATRDGQQLAVVTLNDGEDWADHSKLLNYGFNTYPLADIVNKGDTVEGTTIAVGGSFKYPLLQTETGTVRRSAELLQPGSPGYVFGERGRLRIYVKDVEVGSVPLYEQNSPRMKAAAKHETDAFRYEDEFTERRALKGRWVASLAIAVKQLLVPNRAWQ
ncbi:D-alanyl-D-alanine carboxypeptidase family protein [Paenibacillus koleovorans]|uniref:D-alanyl-D-alanine carboxypeptidase family protein n=1 Tax=Paenibacillus koleovorans TaxID=121608 RepID=UPI000FD6F093|nr:D-alanyl-D-alanine carboxypeptidase family protein [Paenibacillus koleovorans]